MSLSAYTVTNVTYDDFATVFSYSSGWNVPDTSPRDFTNGNSFLSALVDGTYHSTNQVNAVVTLNFTAPAIYLYGLSGPGQGSYRVSLDGGSYTSPVLSAYAANNATNHLLWSANNLTYAPHSLTLTNLGAQGNDAQNSNGLLLDYALATAALGRSGATLTNTTVDDKDSRLTYSGTWSSNNDTRFIGNTSTFTNGNGASVSLTFSGSGVYVFGDTVDDHGIYTVDVDGTSTQYDAKTQNLKIGTLKYFAGNLNSSQHRLTITNNAVTSGTFFDLDAIVYTTPSEYAVVSASNSTSNSTTPAGTSLTSMAGFPSQSARPNSAAGSGSSFSAKCIASLLLSSVVVLGLSSLQV